MADRNQGAAPPQQQSNTSHQPASQTGTPTPPSAPPAPQVPQPEVVAPQEGLAGVGIIYGQPKVGKTTLCHALTDVLIDTEGSADFLPGAKRYRVRNLEELNAAMRACAQLNLRRITIDTFDEVIGWLEEDIIMSHDAKYLNDGELSHGKGWYFLRRRTERLIALLRNTFELILLVVHQKTIVDDNRASDRLRVLDLPGKLARLIPAMSNFIGLARVVETKDSTIWVVDFKPYDQMDSGSRISQLAGRKIAFSTDPEITRRNFNEVLHPSEKSVKKGETDNA